ncbi:hypothetical protein SFR_1428 [Streptomyces sp. FR-008]|nr:hypothetical protein SFR_1428 [Streptomyces sp. FR-008]
MPQPQTALRTQLDLDLLGRLGGLLQAVAFVLRGTVRGERFRSAVCGVARAGLHRHAPSQLGLHWSIDGR